MPSTSTVNGLIATEPDVFNVARGIRKVLEPLFLDEFEAMHKSVSKLLVGGFQEGIALADTPFEGSPDRFLATDRLDRSIYEELKRLHLSNSPTPSRINMFYTVHLLPNANGGNPLVLVEGEKAEQHAAKLVDAGIAKEYGLADAGETAGELSVDERDSRQKAWSIIAGKHPRQVGLKIESPSQFLVSCRIYGW